MIRLALKARKFFPNAPRQQAARQAIAYMKAVMYMQERGIEAVSSGSQFKYERSTGSIL